MTVQSSSSTTSSDGTAVRIFTIFHPGVFTIIHPPLGFALRFLAESLLRGNDQRFVRSEML